MAMSLWTRSYQTGDGVCLTRIAVPAEGRWESHEFYAISDRGVFELSYRQKVLRADRDTIAASIAGSRPDGTFHLSAYRFPIHPLEWQKREQLPLERLGFHAGEQYVNWNAFEDAISYDFAFPDWCIPAVLFLPPAHPRR